MNNKLNHTVKLVQESTTGYDTNWDNLILPIIMNRLFVSNRLRATFPVFNISFSIMTLIFALILVALVIAMALFFLGREGFWATLIGPPDQGPIIFRSFKRSNLPNNALICPEDYCDNSIPEVVAPEFKVSAEKLREELRTCLKREIGLERVHTNDPAMNERYIQRSQTFKFPDTIQVAYIPLGPDRSSIALYSCSQIGFSDRKVNLKRLKRWLKRLDLAVAA
jgi:uncharacterized protein (DUF1499 family)